MGFFFSFFVLVHFFSVGREAAFRVSAAAAAVGALVAAGARAQRPLNFFRPKGNGRRRPESGHSVDCGSQRSAHTHNATLRVALLISHTHPHPHTHTHTHDVKQKTVPPQLNSLLSAPWCPLFSQRRRRQQQQQQQQQPGPMALALCRSSSTSRRSTPTLAAVSAADLCDQSDQCPSKTDAAAAADAATAADASDASDAAKKPGVPSVLTGSR